MKFGACAKTPAGARQNDDSDFVVALGILHGRKHFTLHECRPGVEFIWPIQGNRGHSICYAVERILTGHDGRDYIESCFVSHYHLKVAIEICRGTGESWLIVPAKPRRRDGFSCQR